MKHLVLLFAIYLNVSLGNIKAQEKDNNSRFEVGLGYSIQSQDRRFFELSWGNEVISRENYPFDHQYDLFVNWGLLKKD